MLFKDFALEIQHHILQFCSPSALSSLSRVHTSLRDIAEYVLYRHIHLWRSLGAQNLKTLTENGSLLYTLATNSRKASFVKALSLHLESSDPRLIPSVLIKLAAALEKLPNLVDLHISYVPLKGNIPEGTQSINNVLKSNHFQLQTLALGHHSDFEGFVTSQPNLKLVAVYVKSTRAGVLELYTRIKKFFQQTASQRLPKFVMLDYAVDHANVVLVPSLYRKGEAPEVFEQVGTLSKQSPSDWHMRRGNLKLCLLGISEDNIGLLIESMEAAAVWLRSNRPYYLSHPTLAVTIHGTTIMKPWSFPEFVKALALFENVKTLEFRFLDLDESYEISQDLELCLRKDLGDAWPGVQQVVIYDESEFGVWLYRETGWRFPQDPPLDEWTPTPCEFHALLRTGDHKAIQDLVYDGMDPEQYDKLHSLYDDDDGYYDYDFDYNYDSCESHESL